MSYTPTWYQVEDSDRMLETENALLWADAGTGKTVTALEAFRKGGYDRAVVVCPRLAMRMWQEEVKTHLGHWSSVLNKGVRAKKQVGIILHADTKFLITSMDLAAKHEDLIRAFNMGFPTMKRASWRPELSQNLRTVFIIDEAHMLKNKDAKRTKAIFGDYANTKSGAIHQFNDVWQLTGTPILSHPNDLWTQLVVARREIMTYYGYHKYDKFVETFCTTQMKRYNPRSPLRKVVTGSRNLPLLNQLLKQCGVIKRDLQDVVHELPPITHSRIGTDYTNVPQIPVMNHAMLIKELSKKDSVMAKVRTALGKAKSTDVAKYAAEMGKPPLLVGFWHHAVCEAIVAQLQKHKPNWVITVVDGGTSDKHREDIRAKFNNGEIDCILGQMQAMNTSWNLQGACSHVIIAEELPSPAMLHQFYSRVYRKGQKRHVHVDHMRSSHQIDTALYDIRTGKATTNETILT